MIIDDIINGKARVLTGGKIVPVYDDVLIKIKEAQVINITNVSDYIFAHPQEIWTVWDDVPNFAPPFNNIWFEWNVPRVRNMGGYTDELPQDLKKCKMSAHLISEKNEKEGWHLHCQILMQRPDGLIVIWGGSVFDVSRDGIAEKNGAMVHITKDFANNGATEIIADDIHIWTAIVGIAISFMHCKNTILKQVSHPHKLQQSRAKKGWKPLIRYHTLEIRPIKKILEEEGNTSKNGIQKALHICRGHFKDYRDGKGLFGKYKDMYWWDMHTRGKIENGLVIKDYKVMTR